MNDGTQDKAILEHLERLAAEERLLYARALTDADRRRLSEIKIQRDQGWDLLRQRRALREFGRDPARAKVRAPEVVQNYQL